MFSELLSQFQKVVKEAKTVSSSVDHTLTETRAQFGIKQDLHGINPTHDYANAVSFGKAHRFKELEKQQYKSTDFTQERGIAESATKFTFRKQQRFQEPGQIEESVLHPTHRLTKRNVEKAPVIKPSCKGDLSQSRLTAATMASEMGPAAYFIKDEPKVHTRTFSKGNRFQKDKKNDAPPLFINENQTRKRPPTCAILKAKTVKNTKLISKQQENEIRERVKMIYWQSIPLEIDRLFKNKTGPILRQRYFDISRMRGKERRCAIVLLLRRIQAEKAGYQYDLEQKREAPCAVVYRKSAPKPFKLLEMDPGPDFYYPEDDIVKPKAAAFTFGKAQQVPKQPEIDHRDYDIEESPFKTGANIIINPQHTQHRLTQTQISALNRGPGFYDCLFSQVEKREDIGLVKYQPITHNNARENNCVEIPQVNDAFYFPSYEAMDAKVGVPLYKESAKVEPQHLPDKVLFPQHWAFYDGDLNKVRAEIAKNVILAKGMSYQEYQIHAKNFESFKKYLAAQNHQPQVGEYEPKHVDPHVEGFDMGTQAEKTLIEPIRKEQGHVPGDNLILHPAEILGHQQGIDFNKMQGRPEGELSASDEPKEGDRLLLNPAIRPKKIADIKFEKMQSRAEDNLDTQDPVDGDRLILHPKPVEKHIPNIEFEKQAERPEFAGKANEDASEVVLNPKNDKKIKGFVELRRLSSVRLVPLLRGKEGEMPKR